MHYPAVDIARAVLVVGKVDIDIVLVAVHREERDKRQDVDRVDWEDHTYNQVDKELDFEVDILIKFIVTHWSAIN